MKFVWYLYRKCAGVFVGALFFFVLILCMTDLLLNLWSYISGGVSAAVVGKILWYYVPKTIWYAVPVSVLFATAYVLSDLYVQNELLAVFASGVSLLRFTAPLLLVAFVLTAGLFLFEDAVVVRTYAEKTRLQKQALHREQSLNSEDITVMAEGGNLVYKADFFDNGMNRLNAVQIVFRNADKSFDAYVLCDRAFWDGSRWELSGATVYRLAEDGMELSDVLDDAHAARLTEPPETFRNHTVSVQEVSTSEARAYIAHLERAGLPSAEARAEYYKKFAFPCVVVIVVLLAVALSGRTRKNVLLVSLALCIAAVVAFYVLQMVTMLMAKFGVLPPLFGAWFPVVFFLALSAVLLRSART